MKCKAGWKFVVVNNMIELRKPDGQYHSSICCRKCLPELKKAIEEFERGAV